MKIEELKGSASVRKGSKKIMVPIVGDERESVVQEVADADERKINIETIKASKTKAWNDEIKNEELVIHNGCLKLKGGVLRDVETREYFFWDSKKVVVVRVDTGEIIDERAMTQDEAFQDLEKDTEININNLPDDIRGKLLAFVPKADPLALPAPVEAECTVIDEKLPEHLCASCVNINEQPRCRDGLVAGQDIKFAGDNPDAEVIECKRFDPFKDDGSGTNRESDGTESAENETHGASDETVAHGRKKASSRKKSKKKAA